MAVIGPLSEEDANRKLRVGSDAAGLVSIYRVMHEKASDDDELVAMVIGAEFAEALVRRWNAPLEGPRSFGEFAGDFAHLPARQPLPDSVPSPRS